MDRKPTKIEMFLSMTFIFILVLAIASFFFGIQVGTERTEARFEKDMQVLYAENNAGEYNEQDFASFYHTVLLPYRQFENDWFAVIKALPDMDYEQSISAIKRLVQQSELQSKQINLAIFTEQATKLNLSQAKYKQGLTLFNQALTKLKIGSDHSSTGASLFITIKQDEAIQEAISTVLLAQKQFYSSLLHWSENNNSELVSSIAQSAMTIQQWQTMNLASKNEYTATQLFNKGILQPFMPQDLTAMIDLTLHDKNNAKSVADSILEVIEQLLANNAVHYGDFIQAKNMYNQESLPQLSLFIEP